jgi:brefeldin A-inhibited guanine nucleotide-exchange protein
MDYIQKVIVDGHIRGKDDRTGGPERKLLFQLMESICKCHDLGDEIIELMVLKTLLSKVTYMTLRIHGDFLL